MRRLPAVAASVLGLLLFVTGCTGPSQSGRQGGTEFPADYVRVVSPSFSVVDSSGRPVALPFYGGFNTPRPQFVDIDGDDDQDLFVQEQTGRISFFESVAAGDSSRLVWRTDDYRGLDVGEWFRFADLDQDGVPDLLAEEPYSRIRVYRNVGSETDPEFELFTDTLRTPSGEEIFSDRQNIPNVTDIDCDGRLDLFLGRLDGTITRYEAAADTAGMPLFAHVTDNFEGIEIVNQQMKSVRHGANTLTFADVNGDDAPDLFWGDFFEPGLLLIENTGSCGNPILSGEPEPFPPSNPIETSGYNAPSVVDWTGNGRLDLFVGVLGGAKDANTSLADNFYFYENIGRRYRLRTRQFVGGVDVGSESDAAVGDLNGDGVPDVLVANKIDPKRGNTSLVARLIGSNGPGGRTYRIDGPLDLPAAYHYAPALHDLTDDGTADLVIGTWKGRVAYRANRGDGTFASDGTTLAEIESSHAVPALGDWNGDGRADLIVGGADGTLQAYRNTGSASDPTFTKAPDLLADVDVGNRAAPALFDADGDGVLDLLVGTEEGLYLLPNEGTASAPSFGDTTRVAVDGMLSLPTPAVGDLNGDGRPDLVMGSERGGLVLMQPTRRR